MTEDKKCPKCDSSLHYVEQVGQHYCFSCEAYFEMIDAEMKKAEEVTKEKVEEKKEEAESKPEAKESKLEEKVSCPSCGDAAVLMADTNRYYCYSCEDYIDAGRSEEKKPGEEKAEISATPAVEEKRAAAVAVSSTSAITEARSAQPLKEEPIAPQRETEPAEAIIEKELEKVEKRTCQDCGSALMYVQKYDRWYCQICRKYAPKEGAQKAAAAKKCPTCGGDAKFIDAYNRWYCYACKAYLPVREEAAVQKKTGAPLCPTCGKPLTWIELYQRYYCYPCKKYAPKTETEAAKKKPEGPLCPGCGKQTSWIQAYERYYCYSCRKYVQAGGETKAVPEKPKKGAPKPSAEGPACELCGRPTTWIAQYQRYYCYPCKKYVPLKSSKK